MHLFLLLFVWMTPNNHRLQTKRWVLAHSANNNLLMLVRVPWRGTMLCETSICSWNDRSYDVYRDKRDCLDVTDNEPDTAFDTSNKYLTTKCWCRGTQRRTISGVFIWWRMTSWELAKLSVLLRAKAPRSAVISRCRRERGQRRQAVIAVTACQISHRTQHRGSARIAMNLRN